MGHRTFVCTKGSALPGNMLLNQEYALNKITNPSIIRLCFSSCKLSARGTTCVGLVKFTAWVP